jgi:ABC-type Fe3+-hydroxamate transport system substrate-binding protein
MPYILIALAQNLINATYKRIKLIQQACPTHMPQPRVACLEWLDPPFNAGHWTPELVELAGGLSVTGERGKSSRTMTWKKSSMRNRMCYLSLAVVIQLNEHSKICRY